MNRKDCRTVGHVLARWALAHFLLVISTFFAVSVQATGPRCHKAHSGLSKDNSLIHSALQKMTEFADHYRVQYDPQARFPGREIFPAEAMDPSFPLQWGFSSSYAHKVPEGTLEYLTFQTKAVDENQTVRTIRTTPILTDSIVDRPELLGEIWKTSDGSGLRFLNAGSSLLLEDGAANLFWKKAVEVARQFPGEALNIEVPFNPRWAKAREVILDRQVRASARVTDHYSETKPYLSQDILFGLRNHDHSVPSRNEYLMLLKDQGRSPLVMDADEFQQNLQAVLRLVHLDYRSTDDNMMILKAKVFGQELPHEDRVWLKIKEQVRNFFDQLAVQGGLSVTELTRFNRFDQVPREAMEGLMLRAFETARDPKTKTDLFVLTCDEGLVDYYHNRYGFQVLTRIDPPTPGGKAELIMYLDTRTSLFESVLVKLRQGSQGVVMKPDLNPPSVSKWTSGWELPEKYFSNSPFERKKMAFEQMEQWQNRSKSLILPTVEIPGLSNARPVSVERIREIARQVVRQGASGISKSAQSRLSKKDLSILREQMIFFSEPWIHFLKQASIQAGSRDRLLIVGPETERLKRFLMEQHPNRKIENSWSPNSEQLDHVFLLFQMGHQERGRVRQLLSQSLQSLKHGQRLTVMEKFRDDQYSGGSVRSLSALDEVTGRLIEAYENGSPLSEAQLATVFAMEWSREASIAEVSTRDFLQMAEEAGFIVNSYGLISDARNRTWAITLVKP